MWGVTSSQTEEVRMYRKCLSQPTSERKGTETWLIRQRKWQKAIKWVASAKLKEGSLFPILRADRENAHLSF